MVTTNKLNSIITYWLLFNDLHNNITDFSIDYIVEKYNKIFNKKIVNSKELFEFFSNDKYLQDKTFSYCKYWKINFEELVKDENFGIFIFTVYIGSNNNSKLPTPIQLIDKFKLFFGDFKYINDRDNVILLHEILRRLLKNYQDLFPDTFRDIDLNMKLQHLKTKK